MQTSNSLSSTITSRFRKSTGLLVGISLILISTGARTELLDLGGGLLYDTVLDLTLLTDMNYQATELTTARVDEIVANNTLNFSDGHVLTSADFNLEADAIMNWWGAMAWADQLEYYDPVRGVTYDTWRLPTASPINGLLFDTTFSNNGTTDFGYGLTTVDSEQAHLFYTTLGNLGFCTPNGSGSSSSCDQQPGWSLDSINSGPFENLNTQTYWSGTEIGAEVWAFDFGLGFQGIKTESNKNNFLRAYAVISGDVTAVPLPAAGWLFATGLAGLLGLGARRHRRH